MSGFDRSAYSEKCTEKQFERVSTVRCGGAILPPRQTETAMGLGHPV